ncbi:MAG TPA: BamA/TamA family outer membrane protein [Polyangia bacterium]|nr:BamA/TamA family outer membrane protein [Polyangia bacterium]
MKLIPRLLLAAALGTATAAWAAGPAHAADNPDPGPGPDIEGEPPPDSITGPAEADPAAPNFQNPAFGPRYVLEDIVVRGNRKTQTALIMDALHLRAGDEVGASDARVEAARYRLLALGYFLDARLSLQRGSKRGGAVLLVEVEERGTLIINDIFLSSSRATAFWGGLDASESNFLGRGINLGAGFVASTTPRVPEARAGLGLRAHISSPPLGGGDITLSATGLFNNGSELFRSSGADSDGRPADFVAVGTRRTGGILGVGKTLTRSVRVFLDARQEFVDATLPAGRTQTLPDGSTQTINFKIAAGSSRVASLIGSVDYDTRSDPVLPRNGVHLLVSVEAAAPGGPGSYGFVKTLGQASLYQRMPFGHVLGLHLLGGAIGGNAPYFDQFFVGDLNLLLPRRALGINFATLPSRNLLGAGMAGHRYDDYTGRLLIDYAVPIIRRSRFIYGGDLFVAVGVLGLASSADFHRSGGLTWGTTPIDLTGDLGLRLDTYIGVFTASVANILNRSPF